MRTVKRLVKLIGSGIYGLLGQTIRCTEHRPIANMAKVWKELNLQISILIHILASLHCKQWFHQTSPTQWGLWEPILQMSNLDSQPRAGVESPRDISRHPSFFSSSSSNLGLPTRAVKGDRRLAFKSTVRIKICRQDPFDEGLPRQRCRLNICSYIGWIDKYWYISSVFVNSTNITTNIEMAVLSRFAPS